ncbi:MAG: DUF6249 domain-containing protein [Pseudomonadota bacterium]
MDENWIPIIMFLSIFGSIAAWLFFRARVRYAEQATLQRAIDQGQQLTEDMVRALTNYRPAPFRDLRRGLLLFAIAIALVGFGWLIPDGDEAAQVFTAIALFPALLGAAYLTMHKLGLSQGH